MDRTTALNSVNGEYVDENPGLGVKGTILVAKDRNAIQEEIIGLIEFAGLTPDDGDLTQLKQAVILMPTATLETPRLIGGVSFDGSANINLPGVNAIGNQDTTGKSATTDGIVETGPNTYTLKCKVLTGTSSGSIGGATNVAHGLTATDIFGYSVHVIYTTGSGVNESYSGTAFAFNCGYNATNFSFYPQGASVLSKPFRILVWYRV